MILEIDAGDYKNKRCTICERNYASRANYERHMNTTHKDGKRKPANGGRSFINVDHNIVPVWDDPNHYCRSCKKTYSGKSNYQQHVKRLHSGVLQEAMQLSTSSPSTS